MPNGDPYYDPFDEYNSEPGFGGVPTGSLPPDEFDAFQDWVITQPDVAQEIAEGWMQTPPAPIPPAPIPPAPIPPAPIPPAPIPPAPIPPAPTTDTGTQELFITDAYGNKAYWNALAKRYEYPANWNQPPAGHVSPELQAQIDNWNNILAQQAAEAERNAAIEREKLAQQAEIERKRILEAQKQRLADLKANPLSWLEYSALAGTTPAVQPWMQPLMPQQYQGVKAGEALPGYTEETAFANIPELTTPSAQYMSRINPAAQQQYYGYEKARTGATPEATQWRLWSQAPPTGAYPGVRRI